MKIDNIDNKFNKIIQYLLIMSIILIPFDNLPYFEGIMGELGSKGAIYPMIIIIVIIAIIIVRKRKIYYENTLEKKILIVFICWTIIGAISNVINIGMNEFKGRSGIEKLILQFATFIFLVISFYSIQYIIKNNKIRITTLRKYILISFCIVSAYGVIEALHVYTELDFMWIISKVSYAVNSFSRGGIRIKGIRSVTGEASYLAMYLAFALPWILSYVYTEKKKRSKLYYGLLSLLGVILFICTKSRTAQAILIIESMMFFAMIFIFCKCRKTKLWTLLAIVLTLVTVFGFQCVKTYKSNSYINEKTINENQNTIDNVKKDEESSNIPLIDSLVDNSNMSNVGRFGMQAAAFKIGKNNPFIGVGIGQFGFYVSDNISDEALKSEEVQNWTNNEELTTWPMVHSLYFRIIAEQGFVGVLLWIVLLGITAWKTLMKIIRDENNIIGIFMIISFSGVAMSFLNVDTYALLQFWFMLAVLDMYNNELIDL